MYIKTDMYYFLKPLPAQDNTIFLKFLSIWRARNRYLVISICVSLIVYLFIYLHFLVLFWTCLFHLLPIFFPIELFIISHMFVEVPCLRSRNPPFVMCAANVFSLSIICLCSLFMISFSMQRFWTFINWICQTFSFIACRFPVLLKKLFPPYLVFVDNFPYISYLVSIILFFHFQFFH